ncbi:hypermethylated in cancer 2 protein-like [Betta splendens]|uniref:Hypermethylated in cancer 2 protein-like n=1 Tax=Betta splendens TaxID=158456 RepID=A0A9W2XNP5_BETSP|nr:hypermethylated in cancer 2 protein-like [Betta splendens]
MEGAARVRDARGHAAALLTRLNLQRQQARFCDCVVRQKQSPAQLYPAHRCVLAASSPVLGSVLSSAGVLVELQAPCLSGAVLALLLDYVYTGALPRTGTQEQYHSLLAAARHLQMDALQQDLCEWERSRARAAHGGSESPGNGGSSRDLCVQAAEAEAKQNTEEEEEARTGSSSHRAASRLSPQNHTPNISSTTEGYSASRVHADARGDRFHPAGTARAGTWQNNTHEEMGTGGPPASPASPPRPRRGAVPVICHSGGASALRASAAAAHGAAGQVHSGHELEDLGYRSSADQTGAEDNPPPTQKLCDQCVGDQSDPSSRAGHSVEVDEEPDDGSERRRVSASAATDQRSDHAPPPVDSKGEAREEVLPAQRSPASHRDLYEPHAALHARLRRAAASEQRQRDPHEPDAAALDRPGAPRAGPPAPDPRARLETGGFDWSTSPDRDKTSDAEASEPLFGFAFPEDGAAGQSYRGHVHYHCIPQDEPPHPHRSPAQGPRRRNFTAGTPEQFLLLDISTKPAELLVSYKDRADPDQRGAEGDRDGTSGVEIDGTSGASVLEAGTHLDAECSHSAPRKSNLRAALVREASEDGSRAGARGPPVSARHHAFRCSLCERAFSQRGSLNRHVRSHLGVRPFPCPRCPMTFSRQYRVTEHMRVHQRCSLGADFPHPPASPIGL